MFKNLFISFKTRILLGFCCLIVMMAIIITISLLQFNKYQQNTDQLTTTVLPLALAAEAMSVDVIQVQQFLTDVSATHDPEGYQDAEEAAADFKNKLTWILASDSLNAEQKEEIAQLNTAFELFYDQGKRMAGAYINQGIDAGNAIMESFDSTSDSLTTLMRKFKDHAIDQEQLTIKKLGQSSSEATLLLLVVSVLVITLSFVVAFYLTNYLYKQLGIDPFYAKGIAKEIAKGNFSRDITLEAGDNSSLLYAIKTIQGSINDFVVALEVMANKHAEGWIWETINESVFPGTYGRMAKDINELVRSHIDVKMQVVNVISHYARGDFSIEIDRLPGDKAKITEAIDQVKATLFEVSSEIDALADAGSRGDFSKRANTGKFEFMFREILEDFNTLIGTCEQGFNDILMVTNAMAQGDMTKTIDQDYPGRFGEVISGVNATGSHLKTLVADIKEASETITTAAKEIASGNNDLSHRTEEQAASLEQTAASMQELTSTVQANAENAKRANQLAQSAAGIADKGVAVVGEVVTTMESINASSNKIVDIISVIDGIAFQTNILALNAAVEAARAGDQGRGFAVVASEVRNLAQRAASAAGEIKSLIADSVEKVEGGSKLVSQAGSTMKEIVTSVQQVTSIMSDIFAASVEQSSGIAQVNMAIAQMDDVTQQNAALVEEAAAAAESMEEQTESLSRTVAVFKTGSSTGDNPSVNNMAAIQKSATSKTTMVSSVKAQPIKMAAVPDNKPAIQVDAVIQGLDTALQKHAEWKVKFRKAISHHEKLDVATISKDNCCDFGKWLHGDTKRQLGYLESFAECVSRHAVFHTEAGKVAQTINEGKEKEAQLMLGTESAFTVASSDVGIAIMRLKKDVSSASNAESVKNSRSNTSSSLALEPSDDIVHGLDTALHKHAEWKVKFRKAMANHEHLDAVTISKDDCCDFGKWLHGSIKSDLGHLDSFSDCVTKHALFHVEAGKVAKAINSDKRHEVDMMLAVGSAFTNASSEVGSAIMRLKKDVTEKKASKNVVKTAPKTIASIDDEWDEF